LIFVATDAILSIRLYELHQLYCNDPVKLEVAHAALLSEQPAPSFAKENPVYEKVCMGQRKTCVCQAPFFF
jgi:RNA exonuclease 4